MIITDLIMNNSNNKLLEEFLVIVSVISQVHLRINLDRSLGD